MSREILTPQQRYFIQACVTFGLPKPVVEYRFHPKRMWRIDYYFHEARVAVEVEGGIWTKGRHTRGAGFAGDIEKYNEMTCHGIRLLRTTPDGLLTSKTLNYIKRCHALTRPTQEENSGHAETGC
jgi:very-short-patch-repair endonuclease